MEILIGTMLTDKIQDSLLRYEAALFKKTAGDVNGNPHLPAVFFMLIGITQQRKGYLFNEAPVGNGLARSDREAAFGTAYRKMHGGIYGIPSFPNIQPWFQSGFADGMSKPVPYG